MKHFLALMMLAFLVTATACVAPGGLETPPRPELTVPRASQPPAVDASPDDPAWTEAARIAALSLSTGVPARKVEPVPTVVKLLWSPTHLYVRFICKDDEPYAPFEGRDEPHYKGDVVEVFLDPVGDAHQWYEVQVTPTNQILDKLFIMSGEPASGSDLALTRAANRDLWSCLGYTMSGLETAARTTNRGWIVDLALPAEAITRRMPRQRLEPMRLRMNLLRYEWPQDANGNRPGVFMNWSPVSWGQPHRSPKAMGFVRLVED